MSTDRYHTGNNPYVGPIPCTERDANNFFGRNEELNNLLLKIRTQTLTIISAESGAGKTSLIQAGLIPAFRLGRDRDPENVGFTLYVSNWSAIAPGREVSQTKSTTKDPVAIMEIAIIEALQL